jgi:hypothetical protein
MKSRATGAFWNRYHTLPAEIQKIADKQYRLWISDSFHPSLNFKKVGRYWSARVTEDYRSLGVRDGDTIIWFWIGTHREYDRLLKQQ